MWQNMQVERRFNKAHVHLLKTWRRFTPSEHDTTRLDTLKSIVDTIKRNIVAEKLYGDEIDSVVSNISATELLLKGVLPLYTKFCRNRNQDGNGYFAGLRMTVAKCIIFNNYVAP